MADTYLTSTFKDKDRVKALGARWDAERRQWYVPAGRDLAPFAAWIPVSSGGSSTTELAVPAGVLSASTAVSVVQKGISLAQLMSGVVRAVAQAYPSAVWTRVEVTNVRLNRGAVYLELAERERDGTAIAQARGVIWPSTADEIVPAFERATGIVLGGGIKLLVRAKPTMHASFGLSLVIDAIDPEYTLGDLEARKREIRARLQREGLFERNRSLVPPWDFWAVLVLAPQGAAGLGDFQAEAKRLERWGVCRFVYVISRFQGEGAAAEMRQALLDGLAAWEAEEALPPDAVVIIRGGGAVNDLAWLNDYDLARWVCETDVPVLTGIGHERDNTLLDEVANQRFDTPSKVVAGIEQTILARVRETRAAYEAVVRTGTQAVHLLRRQVERLNALVKAQALRSTAIARSRTDELMADTRRSARDGLKAARLDSGALFGSIRTAALAQIHDAKQVLPVLVTEVKSESRRSLREARSRVRSELRTTCDRAAQSVRRAREDAGAEMQEAGWSARRIVQSSMNRAEALIREITGQGPEKTLRRGFAIVRGPNRVPLTSAGATKTATAIEIEFYDGTVPARPVGEENQG